MITNVARFTRDIKSKIAMAKAALNTKRLFFSPEIWTLILHLQHRFALYWNVDTSKRRSQITGKFKMWCWRRTEKTCQTYHARNEEVLRRIKEKRNILHAVKERRLILLVTSFVGTALWNNITEGKIEVSGRRGRRSKQLLHDFKDNWRHGKVKNKIIGRSDGMTEQDVSSY
jgi:hypothetical protein